MIKESGCQQTSMCAAIVYHKPQESKWWSGTQRMPVKNGKYEANLLIVKSHQIKLYNWPLSNAPAMLSRKDVSEPWWDNPRDAQMYFLLAASYVEARRSCHGAQYWWNIWLSAILGPPAPQFAKPEMAQVTQMKCELNTARCNLFWRFCLKSNFKRTWRKNMAHWHSCRRVIIILWERKFDSLFLFLYKPH